MGNPSASWPGRPALSVSSGSDEKPLVYGIKGKRDGSRLLLSAFMRTCRHTTQAYVCHTQRDWKKTIKKDGILRMEGISGHPKQSLEESCEEHCPGYWPSLEDTGRGGWGVRGEKTEAFTGLGPGGEIHHGAQVKAIDIHLLWPTPPSSKGSSALGP